jgi:ABC-type transport system involved in cytochrome c biogenesis, permease component
VRLLLLLPLLLCATVARALDTTVLESLPVQEGGRKKPYLVFAQESLLSISGRKSVEIDGRKRGAMEVVTDIWMQPEGWDDRPLIRIDHLTLKEAAGLDKERKLFSHAELAGNPAFVALLRKAQAAKGAAKDGRLAGIDKQVEEVGLRLADFEQLRNGELFRVVANPESPNAPWFTLRPDDPTFAAAREAWISGNETAWKDASSALVAALATQAPEHQPPAWKLDLERIYQKSHPFAWAWKLYLAAGIVLAVTSLRGRERGYVVGWILAGAGFALQVFGFVCRIVIAGRPPVSNMYESVIWVAFGAVAFALVFEAIYRGRLFLVAATWVAVVPLMLADFQPLALDQSIQPLVPVLQSNFWLATHVLIITLGYAAFLLALAVAHIALGKVILGGKPSAAIYNYIYRALQIGVLLLAVGTILGAVWANYSWGRFWDWDPKETWALIALLAYLFLLHGRIAGLWGGFGLAVGSVLGFLTVVMAWYGVNFVLGVGLHSYGFGAGGFEYALGYIAIELVFTAIAVVRYRAQKASSKVVPARERQAAG